MLHNKILTTRTSFSVGLLILAVNLPIHAQTNSSYQLADQFFQQQNYKQAYQILSDLHSNHPNTYIFYDKTVQCLINLKRYNQAINVSKQAIKLPYYPIQASIKLGEIYHVKGDTSQAFLLWGQILKNHSKNLQTYLSIARSMSDRRSFSRAIETYKKAISIFPNSIVLTTELANTYLQAGKYEDSIREYLQLVKEQPERMDYIQTILLRFNDKHLYDVAILEIDDFLHDLPVEHQAHPNLQQLEVWLLIERGLYQRALATARKYEKQQSQISYTLYGLGNKLLAEQKFKLAEEAYSYYIKHNIQPVKNQCLEEVANVYIEWAHYLSHYNLAYSSRRDSLYQQAYHTLNRLLKTAPSYSQKNRVLVTQSELALDYLHDASEAEQYLDKLDTHLDSSFTARKSYLEGRIKLYNKDYSRARIAFTKSNRQEQIGELAEKTRYFLALTDFYAGDYEFAKIQLNALEHQNTSYYANDAVQLRVWIQRGLQADSTGSIIKPFATAVEYFSQGTPDKAIQQMKPIFRAKAYHPLMAESLLQLSSHIIPQSARLTYAMLTDYLRTSGKDSPLRERLMWEKARIADQMVTKEIHLPPTAGDSILKEFALDPIRLPSSRDHVVKLYENILLDFPQGFYSDFARSRIKELQKPQT